MSSVACLTVPSARESGPPEVGAIGIPLLDAQLEVPRVAQLATALGCSADVDAIARTLLQQTALGESAYQAVWSSVDHLLNHDRVWRAMVTGVVPPSLRAQAMAAATRTDPTDPGDSIPALVFAAVGRVLSDPRLSQAQEGAAGRAMTERLFLRVRARFTSRLLRTA